MNNTWQEEDWRRVRRVFYWRHMIRTPEPFSGACGSVIGRMASILVSMNRSASDLSVYCVYFLNRRQKTVDLRTCGGGGWMMLPKTLATHGGACSGRCWSKNVGFSDRWFLYRFVCSVFWKNLRSVMRSFRMDFFFFWRIRKGGIYFGAEAMWENWLSINEREFLNALIPCRSPKSYDNGKYKRVWERGREWRLGFSSGSAMWAYVHMM